MTDVKAHVLEALRHYAVSYQESAHHLAEWMDLPSTDGAALGEILWAENAGRPLFPAQLKDRIGLTSGATNALVNRLEALDLVTRSRESNDRRIVSLRVTQKARDRSDGFIRNPARELESALDEYTPEVLETVRGFLERFAAILPTGTEHRRESGDKNAPAAGAP